MADRAALIATAPHVANTNTNGRLIPYFFHPDHLGSSAYVTNRIGVVSQHTEYLPFGETLTDEHINSQSSPFKYNGKHLDEETGNYYYGARYYDPKLSIFISVDPLAEKTMSPYGYCYNNPIRFTDPTGMESDDIIITGKDADLAVKELNSESSLNLVRDSQTGKVTMADKSKIDYNSLSCTDQALYDTIEDTKTVNLSTTQDITRTNSKGGQDIFLIGKHNGQTSSDSFQEINVLQAQGLQAGGGQSAVTSIRHEILEGAAALGIVNSPGLPTGFSPGFMPPAFARNVFNQAHTKAMNIDPSYNLNNLQGNQFYLQSSPKTLWMNLNSNANFKSQGWFKLQ